MKVNGDVVCVGVGVGVGLEVGVGVGVGVGVEVGSTGFATGVDDGLGAAFTVTPLFHTKRVPDSIQVNFLPPADAVAPALVHFAPAFTAAKVGAEIRDKDSSRARNIRVRNMR